MNRKHEIKKEREQKEELEKHISSKHKRKIKNKAERDRKITIRAVISLVAGVIVGIGNLILTKNLISSGVMTLSIITAVVVYFIVKERLKVSARINKMELVFPDFIELMASNLRAGMTIDSALLLSSRKEFVPLDE